MLGKRVGKYKLGRTLGRGGFGKVKFAQDTKNGKEVAIKILDRERVLQRNLVEQTKREISVMKLINHPYVVKLIEVMATTKEIYLVLDFVKGGELYDRIKRAPAKRLDEDEARRYFQQLIDAVGYCHSKGVYHRDLKPQNLLLDEDGTLKVSDFGCSAWSRQLGEDGLLHTCIGTQSYSAPEVFTAIGYHGQPADIWSCGVILFVLLSGTSPFQESTLREFLNKIRRAIYICPIYFSPEVRQLIRRLLDPNPETRITIPNIYENEWFKTNYTPPQFEPNEDVDLDDVECAFNSSEGSVASGSEERPESMTAFEFINKALRHNVENLYSSMTGYKEPNIRFASKSPVGEIMSRIEELVVCLGYEMQTRRYKMKFKSGRSGSQGQGQLCINAELFELAPSVYMLELWKIDGNTLEFDEFIKEFALSLNDVLWKCEQVPK